MYRVNIPARLTEEEKLLKKKYKLLREKREELKKLSMPKLPKEKNYGRKENEVVDDSDSISDESESCKRNQKLEKKPVDPKEVAKKLVQSGAIVLKKKEQPRVFKRRQAFEPKLPVKPPLKMKLKRVYQEEGPNGDKKEDLVGGTSKMRSRSPQCVYQLSTESPPLRGPSSSGMEVKPSLPQPSSSSSFIRMDAGSSSSTAMGWQKLAEANRQRMNETRGDFMDYKRRGLVSYRDLNESSDDED